MADMLAEPEDLAALLQQDLDRATTELLLECATAVVQGVTKQRILQVVDDVVTLYLDEYDRATYLYLPERPVTAVGAVLIGATAVTDWSPQLNRARLFRADGWRSTLILYDDAPTTATVTYTHGYPAGHQKLQLARSAVLALASQGYTNPSGAVREQIDDYSVQYAEMASRMAATPQLIQSLRSFYGFPTRSARLIRS